MADGDLHTVRVGPRTFTYEEGTEEGEEAPFHQSDMKLSSMGMADAGNNPIEHVLVVAVTSIADPSTELANYAGRAAGALLIVRQVGAATDLHTLYAWDASDSGGADIPYVVAGSSGFWVAIGGRYKDGDVATKGDITSSGKVDVTGNLETDGVVKIDNTQVVSSQGAHIADANEHGEGDGDADADEDADISVSDAAAASSNPADLPAAVAKVDYDASMTILNELGTAIEGNAGKYNTLAAKYNALAVLFNALRADYNDLRAKFNTSLSQQEDHGLNANV